jgi:hypothetical protein
MLYFDLLPDDIIVILFKYHFKDVKELSQVSERLQYNYDKVIPLIKNGNLNPDAWCNEVNKVDTEYLKKCLNKCVININDVFVDEDVSNMIFINENIILEVFYNIICEITEYVGFVDIIYKVKSSKELLEFLLKNGIDISKSDEVYVNINQYWNTQSRDNNIYINSNWNKLWNMQLNDNIRKQILRDNNII